MKIEITWLGHAAYRIKANDKIIYIDPRFMKAKGSKVKNFFENPEKADIILITHHHADHCYAESFGKMINSQTIIIGPELCNKKLGNDYKKIIPGDKFSIYGINIQVVHAYNIHRRRSSGGLWHEKGNGVGYVISFDGKTIYHPGDTEFISEMKNLGLIDLVFVPIDGKFTMNVDEAVIAVKEINPKIAVPMHIMDSNPIEFKDKIEKETSIKVMLLEWGESILI
ncbi:MAG: MBL fold metallo-hydrolase [Methanofastidiosum sp.]